MNLFVDVGNSRIKWATSETGEIGHSTAQDYRLDNLSDLLMERWKVVPSPERVFVSNVAGTAPADILVKVCNSLWSFAPDFISVEKETCGVINGYRDIKQLGVDRWLSIIAAWSEYQTNVCVVGCGTAVTIDLVLANGQHLGGYIIPGVHMMQWMLTQYTQGIDIELYDSDGIDPGQSTETCVSHGASLAVVTLIDRVVSDFRRQHPEKVECVITGGGASNLLSLLAIDFNHESDLVLQGISLISKGIKT